jgi:protein TonB
MLISGEASMAEPAAKTTATGPTAATVVAVLLHAALIGFLLYAPATQLRQLGEQGGDGKSVSVDVISEADLPGAAVTPAATPSLVPPAPPRPGEGSHPAEPEVPDPAAVLQARPADVKPSPPQDLASLPQHLLEVPLESKTPAKPKPEATPPDRQPHAQTHKSAAIDFNLPPLLALGQAGAGGPGLTRPAGITRSGANDDFGRGVIRALRQTMPPPQGRESARLTVRFQLDDNGNLVRVEIVAASGDPVLDQNVAFAVRQTNFPFPPTGSTPVDRRFYVTYVYR